MAKVSNETALEAVNLINDLLSFIKIPLRISSLKDCVSSLWVALYEGLASTRLPGVISPFSSHPPFSDAPSITLARNIQIQNVNLVLSKLSPSAKLKIDAEKVVDGDENSIVKLSTMLGAIPIDDVEIKALALERDSDEDVAEYNESIENDFGFNTTTASNRVRVGPSSRLHGTKSSTQFSRVNEDLSTFDRSLVSSRNVEEDVEPMKRTLSSSTSSSSIGTSKSTKKIRFDLSQPPEVTSPVSMLKVTPSDSPFTKALKLRRMRMMNETQQLKTRTKSREIQFKIAKAQVELENVAKRAKSVPAVHFDPVLSRHNDSSSSARISGDDSWESSFNTTASSGGGLSGDFERLDRVLSIVSGGMNTGIANQREEISNLQVKTWKRALDNRVWTRKANEGKRKSNTNAQLAYMNKEAERDRHVKAQKLENLQKVKVKSELTERKRQAIKMESYQNKVNDELKRTKHKLTERASADQIKLTNEQLKEAQEEERLAIKAQEAELKRKVREEKAKAQYNLKKIREKLDVDVENAFNFLEEQTNQLAANLRVKAVPRRNVGGSREGKVSGTLKRRR